MNHSERRNRQPLYVPVATQPELEDCWSVNLSTEGIGLTCADARSLAEGDELVIEFALPDAGSTVRARGSVQWLALEPESGRPTLGVLFSRLSGENRMRLSTYLADYRFHVAVVGDLPPERQHTLSVALDEVDLHFAESVVELLDLLGRGDIATVLAYPSAEEDLEQILQAVRKPALAGRGRAPSEDDLVPRILCVGNLEGAYLVRQFNQRRIFRALPLNVETSRLRSSVEEAIRDYGVRTEQRRATIALQRALARNTSRRDRAPRSGLASQMVLESLAMRRVLELTRVAAPHRVTVLLEGETGVGKDVMARIIHELSDRSQSAFVVQDCGTLSETLMESELFGHVKGAFTSAVSNHPGIFALADGGTVFLDEIENTSPAMQAKLLRVLETGQIRPVGGTRMRTVDVRLIVASNRDLRNEVSLGRFREDLFYRVNTFPITVPALRERPDDIVPLSERFIELANQSLNKSALGIDEEASRALRSYPWPGNIRELRNVIERAVLLTRGPERIRPSMLPSEVTTTDYRSDDRGLDQQLRTIEERIIRDALLRHGGVVRRAAQELQLNPVTLGRRIKKLGMQVGRTHH